MTKTVAIMAVINSALAIIMSFGWEVSDAQQAAVLGGANALLLLIAVIRDPNVPFSLKKKTS